MENLRGIAWMVLSMGAFAIGDAMIKAMSGVIGIGMVVLVMGVGGGAVMIAVAKARGVTLIDPVMLSPAILLRGMAELVAGVGILTALATVPLATVATMIQASPILITLGAALILREAVGWRRWSAIAVGFAGVLIIVRPTTQDFDPFVLFAVMGALGLAGRDLASRAIPASVSNLQVAVYGYLVNIPIALVLLPFSGWVTVPTWPVAGLLVATVLASVIAYFAITVAARTGEISAVMPFRYSRLIFAILLGLMFFDEVPDAMTLLGAALIVGAGLFSLWRETVRRRRAAGPRAKPAA